MSQKPTPCLTATDREICNAIGFDAKKRGVDALSPNVRDIAIILSQTQLIDRWLKIIKEGSAKLLAMDDYQFVKAVGLNFSSEGVSRIDLEKRDEVIKTLRDRYKFISTSAGRKDIKKFLSLIAAGLQLAYDKYGSNAAAERILVTDQFKTGLGYLPPKKHYQDIGVTLPSTDDGMYDTIVLHPIFLRTYMVDDCLDHYMIEKNAHTISELLVRQGYEEAYHAWQNKDPEKWQDLLSSAKKINPNNPREALSATGDQIASMTRDQREAIHQVLLNEIDADKALNAASDPIKKAARELSPQR